MDGTGHAQGLRQPLQGPHRLRGVQVDALPFAVGQAPAPGVDGPPAPGVDVRRVRPPDPPGGHAGPLGPGAGQGLAQGGVGHLTIPPQAPRAQHRLPHPVPHQALVPGNGEPLAGHHVERLAHRQGPPLPAPHPAHQAGDIQQQPLGLQAGHLRLPSQEEEGVRGRARLDGHQQPVGDRLSRLRPHRRRSPQEGGDLLHLRRGPGSSGGAGDGPAQGLVQGREPFRAEDEAQAPRGRASGRAPLEGASVPAAGAAGAQGGTQPAAPRVSAPSVASNRRRVGRRPVRERGCVCERGWDPAGGRSTMPLVVERPSPGGRPREAQGARSGATS